MAPPSQWFGRLGPALLAPGPYPVGFRSAWAFDEGRTYRTAFDDGKTYGAQEAPRPVLVLQWYPAHDRDGDTMEHATYFSIASDDPALREFAYALREYAHTMFSHYVMDKPEDELDEAERAQMAETLTEPTGCLPGAEPAGGGFPLIVYHGGYGSSFEDNAALCTFLASHGYLVLGSAFPRADGLSLNIDAFRGSADDVTFLIRWAGTHCGADIGRVGLIGHSGGAQAILRIAVANEIRYDAAVLLDTTQDYYCLSIPFFAPLVREITDGIANVTTPMLVVANPAALFALCDTLVNSERTYLTVPSLPHDEFIAQGQQRLARIARSPHPDPADSERAAVAHELYRAVCERVLRFLDATVRGDREAGERFGFFCSSRAPDSFCSSRAPDSFCSSRAPDSFCSSRAPATESWDPTTPCVVQVPRGVGAPEPYDPDGDIAPSPRQFAQLLMIPGIEQACRALGRFRSSSGNPVCSDVRLAGTLLYHLLGTGRDDDAARYYAMLKDMSMDVAGWLVEQADDEEGDETLHFLCLAQRLEPDDADIAAKLQAARGA